MVTDKRRHDVARKLRELNPEDRRWFGIHGFDWFMFADSLFDAIGCNGSRNWTDYLADLIEPPARCPHYMNPCCRTDAAGDYIDRDALLKLADELEDSAIESSNWDVPFLNASEVMRMAHRIRRALENGQ